MSNLRDAAQSIECSLMILRKDKDGWVFGFRVHPDEAPRSLLDASLGTRFRIVFFEIADDETFVVPDEVRRAKKAVAISGQMCREVMFQKWILDKAGLTIEGIDPEDVESTVSRLLRNSLEISSRSELLENEKARDSFRELLREYKNETREGHLPGSDY